MAAAAGVSVTTVSHILNDVEGKRISPTTRARVQKVAKSLGYAPNQLARGLRLQRSQTVGLISDEIATTPFAGQIIAGAQDAAKSHGSLLIVMNTGGDPELEDREARLLLDRQIDGILYATMYHRKVVVPPVLDEVPVVLLDAVCDDPAFSSVVPDEVAGGLAAVGELLDAGHRDIAFLNCKYDIPASYGRLEGFRRRLVEAGLPADRAQVIAGDASVAGGYECATELLRSDHRPTGVFCFNDRMAMGCYQVAAELGLRIPEDLSVVGFDNMELIADSLRPGLTTVALPFYEMGTWAADQLFTLLAATEGERPPAVSMRLPGPVVRRASVAPPRT